MNLLFVWEEAVSEDVLERSGDDSVSWRAGGVLQEAVLGETDSSSHLVTLLVENCPGGQPGWASVLAGLLSSTALRDHVGELLQLLTHNGHQRLQAGTEVDTLVLHLLHHLGAHRVLLVAQDVVGEHQDGLRLRQVFWWWWWYEQDFVLSPTLLKLHM